MRTLWVVLVTDGTVVEYPPELYLSRALARREARRWADVFSAGGQLGVREPFEGRWEIGYREVRLVPTERESLAPGAEPWIGTFWTSDGYPEPEALLLPGKDDALAWATAPLASGMVPSRIEVGEWGIAVTFGQGDNEAYAVAKLAKVVCELPEVRQGSSEPGR